MILVLQEGYRSKIILVVCKCVNCTNIVRDVCAVKTEIYDHDAYIFTGLFNPWSVKKVPICYHCNKQSIEKSNYRLLEQQLDNYDF